MPQLDECSNVILSDLHLNSGESQPDTVFGMLEFIERSKCRQIDIAGDVVDNPNLTGDERRIWDELVDLSHVKKVTIELGNHDDISGLPLGQMSVVPEHLFSVSNVTFMVEHGHPHDPSLNHPAKWWVRNLMKLERPAKKFPRFYHDWVYMSPTWLQNDEAMAQSALNKAKAREVDVVICGHAHRPFYRSNGRVAYYNLGSCCEGENPYRQSTLGTIGYDGQFKLHGFSVDGEYQGIVNPAQLVC